MFVCLVVVVVVVGSLSVFFLSFVCVCLFVVVFLLRVGEFVVY